MQLQLRVSRQVSSKLREQIVLLERQCWSNCQYSRGGCLELSVLLESIENSELEDTALKLIKKLDVEIGSFNNEDCQWLPSKEPKRVIIKFSKRKDANSIQRVKKNLKGMDLSSIGIRSPVYTRLPNFPRDMAIRVRTLGNKKSMVQWLPTASPCLVVKEKCLILEGLDRWKMHY